MTQIAYIFRILSHFGRQKSCLIVFILIIASLIESIGIATLLPLFAIASGDGQIESEIARKLISAFEYVGLPTSFAGLSLIVAATLISREIIMFLAMSYIGTEMAGLSLRYRQRILKALFNADWRFFSKNEMGNTAVELTTFTESAANAVNLSARTLALAVRTVFYLGIIIVVSGYFAFLAFAAGTLSVIALSSFVTLSKKYGKKKANLTRKLSAHFIDIFSSIKSIKTMGRENGVASSFTRNIVKMNKTLINLVFLREGLSSLQRVIELFVILATLFIAVKFWKLEIIEIGLVGLLMSQVMMNISKCQKMLQKAMKLDVFYWRTQETIKEIESAEEKKSGRKTPNLKKHILFNNVSFSFPDKQILKDAEFSIPANKITVIFGPSGQGKTTVTDLISRLYAPQDGEILIDNINLKQINAKSWRKSIGYVPQELLLLNNTIRENIKFGLSDLSDAEVNKALDLSGSAEFVEELENGLDSLVGEKGMKLSGGQRQRLSIARGLVHDPKILILDEITSALDAENEKRICQRIKGLKKGRTIIAITHRPEWLKIADNVLHIKDGKVRSE